MIRILSFGWEFPPVISGGLGVACEGITLALAKTNRIFNHFLLPTTTTAIKNIAPITNTHFYPIDISIQPYSINTSSVLAYASGHYNSLFESIVKFSLYTYKATANIEFDIIHCHDWMTILSGINLKQQHQKPLVFHVHSLESDRSYINPSPAIVEIEKFGMEQADAIIAVSEYTKNCIVRDYNICHDKITVIHNGIDTAFSQPLHKKPNKKISKITFLGRFTEQKGPQFFIDIAKRLLFKQKDLLFIMAGSGDQKQELESHIERFHLEDNIHILDFLDRKAVITLLNTSDVFVMPSRSEPFGLVAVEAIANGTPIVISKQSGVAEVFPEALSADYFDVELFANHIEYYLNHPEMAHSSVLQCQNELKNYTWSRCANKLLCLYDELLKKN